MPNPFTPAWLAGDPAATQLLPRSSTDPAARAAAVRVAVERRADPRVVEALVATTPAQRAARDKLARGGVAAVVTGQQAGLFGGPLYTIYKAAAAIADARALSAETGIDCVPVFWLQDEDHDYDEIATATVLGADGRLHELTVPGREADAGRSIASRRYGDGVLDAVRRAEEVLAGFSDVGPLVESLRAAYRPGTSPAAAFRALVEGWFGEHGLLVVDPADPRLAEAARPVHRVAIERAGPIADALTERVEALAAAGFAVQVHVRPGAPLSFFHPDGPDGPRFRVDGERLVGRDGRVTAEQLLDGHCTTSALLRPILQDTWLPTAAYVGGPGEIAYFAQLPPLYEAFGVPLPLVVPRARFRVHDEGTDRLLAQLALTPTELEAPREQILRGRSRPDPEAAGLAEAARAAAEVLAGYRERASDPALQKAAERTGATVAEAIGRLLERHQRTASERDAVTVERLDRLLARLVPGGAPQERVLAWPWAGARFGPRFVEAVLGAVVPFDGSLRELRP